MSLDIPPAQRIYANSQTLDVQEFLRQTGPIRRISLLPLDADMNRWVIDADKITESDATMRLDASALTPGSPASESLVKAATEEALALGWQVEWRFEDDAMIASVPAAEAEKVAASTFDLYARLASRLGSAFVRDVPFEYEIADE